MSAAATEGSDARGWLEGRLAEIRKRIGLDASRAAAGLHVLYAGMAAYAALFVFASVLHYSLFETPQLDLGNMVQAIWNTQHGHLLDFTTTSGHQRDRLGFHVDPFLLLFVPLFWIWSSPVLLLVVQVVAVTSGALPVFWLARKHLGSSRAGAHLGFAYLLYPITQFNAFTIAAGFHAVSLAVPLVLYAIWFLDEDRLVAFSTFALLAAATKEEIPLAVGCLGIWYAVRKGHRRFGLGVFAIGTALTLFNFFWVIPHFAPAGANPYAGRYGAVGGSPQGIVHKFFTDPAAFVHAVATGHKAVYLGFLLVPFLGLWLLEPLLLLGAVPDLAINLLSSKPDQTLFGYQDTAGIAPFVVAASVFGVVRFKNRATSISMWVLVVAAFLAIFSPINFLGHDVRALGSPATSAKAHALSLIPEGVAVSASNQLGGHLSQRRYIYAFPSVGRSRWIVVDVRDPTLHVADPKSVLRSYETKKDWRIVFSAHGVTVLQKRTTPGA